MKSNKKPIILGMGKAGYYTHMSPRFENASLNKTNDLVKASNLIPFGMTEDIESPTCGYSHQSNSLLNQHEVHLKSFKQFIELLIAIAEKHGAQYVLVTITKNAHCGTYWELEGRCQLFVKPVRRSAVFQFLIELFCRHSYELVDKDEILPTPAKGERIFFERNYVCTKCGKHQLLGSGWIYG